MQDQASPCLKGLLCSSVHHSCQSSTLAQHHQHVEQLCRARCFGLCERMVYHQGAILLILCEGAVVSSFDAVDIGEKELVRVQVG